MQKISTIILAAGNATRMQSQTPKPLLQIGNQSILEHALNQIQKLNKDYNQQIIIVQQNNKQINTIAKDYNAQTITQRQQLGTAHATLQCKHKWGGCEKILILFGDTPFTPATLMKKLLNQTNSKNPIAIAAFQTNAPNAYGRIILDENNTPLKIIEAKDATKEQLNITLCNGGIMALHKSALPLLAKITNNNKQSEYFLPHIVDIARKHKLTPTLIQAEEQDFMGVNSPEDLQRCEAIFQNTMRQKMLKGGVRMTDPNTVYFSADTKIAKDVTIEPFVIFGPKVTIQSQTHIHGFSHIAGAKIASGASIGPFARIRPQTNIGKNTKIGNFVEVKNTNLQDQAKASHLTYLGDSNIGQNANIGAGVITANYDGKNKHKTSIGDNANIGANVSLVAPVKIGNSARIGAGSTITENVKDKSLTIVRTRQPSPPSSPPRSKKSKGSKG